MNCQVSTAETTHGNSEFAFPSEKKFERSAFKLEEYMKQFPSLNPHLKLLDILRFTITSPDAYGTYEFYNCLITEFLPNHKDEVQLIKVKNLWKETYEKDVHTQFANEEEFLNS